MENNKYNIYEEPEQNKAKSVWAKIGLIALSLFLAVLTIIVINL